MRSAIEKPAILYALHGRCGAWSATGKWLFDLSESAARKSYPDLMMVETDSDCMVRPMRQVRLKFGGGK